MGEAGQRRLAENAARGFVDGGRERHEAVVDGKWHDDLVMSLLAYEYPQWADGP